MALLFMDSFDHYATADVAILKWTQRSTPSGDASVIAAVGRHSSNGWKMATNSTFDTAGALFKTLAPGDNTITVGLAFRSVTAFTALPNVTNPNSSAQTQAPTYLLVRSASTDQCWVRVDQAGTLSVYRGSTLLGTTSAALTQNVYAYIEVRLTIHTTTGTVDIHVNGASVLALTGQKTAAAGTNAWNELRVSYIGSGSTALEWNFDDGYVLDGTGSAPWNTFLGDCRVDACVPTGAGAHTDWNP